MFCSRQRGIIRVLLHPVKTQHEGRTSENLPLLNSLSLPLSLFKALALIKFYS